MLVEAAPVPSSPEQRFKDWLQGRTVANALAQVPTRDQRAQEVTLKDSPDPVGVLDCAVLEVSVPPTYANLSETPVKGSPQTQAPERREPKFASALDESPEGLAAMNMQVNSAGIETVALGNVSSTQGQQMSVEKANTVKFVDEGGMFPGDYVEFCYQGTWLPGVLQSISGDAVAVNLDCDKEQGLVTKGPLSMVRPAPSQPEVVTTREAEPPGNQELQDKLQAEIRNLQVQLSAAVSQNNKLQAELTVKEPIAPSGLPKQQQAQTTAGAEPGSPVKMLKLGERVELFYDNKWLEGTLESRVGDWVYVKLDVDGESDEVAKAPLNLIRWVNRITEF